MAQALSGPTSHLPVWPARRESWSPGGNHNTQAANKICHTNTRPCLAIVRGWLTLFLHGRRLALLEQSNLLREVTFGNAHDTSKPLSASDLARWTWTRQTRNPRQELTQIQNGSHHQLQAALRSRCGMGSTVGSTGSVMEPVAAADPVDWPKQGSHYRCRAHSKSERRFVNATALFCVFVSAGILDLESWQQTAQLQVRHQVGNAQTCLA